MKYMGSKSRVAKYIVPVIQNHIDDEQATLYIEPFVGGANVIDKIAAERRIGADINKYLVALLRYVQRGGELPPAIDREEYSRVRAVKDDFDDWYVGCAGFLASYNGKFFGGYAGTVNTKAGTVRDYYAEARANLAKQAWGGFKT